MLKPTEIVLIPFPFTDLSSTKKRPVLIIRKVDELNDFICVPLTSQNGYENSILISNNDLIKGNLPKLSWVRIDKIVTLSADTVVGHIAQLNEDTFQNIKQAICKHLECCF